MVGLVNVRKTGTVSNVVASRLAGRGNSNGWHLDDGVFSSHFSVSLGGGAEALKVRQGQAAQRFRHMIEEPADVPPVAAAGVRAGLPLEPEVDDVGIAGRRDNPPSRLLSRHIHCSGSGGTARGNLLRLSVRESEIDGSALVFTIPTKTTARGLPKRSW
jgi:hypothetical protein